MKKPSKYNNRKVELDGFTFDSQKEERRYSELKLFVRDSIRRYGDRKFGTKQVGNDVLVTRTK